MNPINIYTRISNDLRYKIITGKYTSDQKLPSERILSEEYNVQRITIRKALDLLLLDRYIYVVDRKGYFVNRKNLKRSNEEINTVTDNFKSIYPSLELQVISFEDGYVNQRTSKKIKSEIGTPIYKFKRLLSIGKINVAIESFTLIKEKCKGISIEDTLNISLYNLLSNKFELIFANSETEIKIVYSTVEEMQHLNLESATSLLKEETIISDNKISPFLYYECIILPEYIAYSNQEII